VLILKAIQTFPSKRYHVAFPRSGNTMPFNWNMSLYCPPELTIAQWIMTKKSPIFAKEWELMAEIHSLQEWGLPRSSRFEAHETATLDSSCIL
jgi:hypothetical protein